MACRCVCLCTMRYRSLSWARGRPGQSFPPPLQKRWTEDPLTAVRPWHDSTCAGGCPRPAPSPPGPLPIGFSLEDSQTRLPKLSCRWRYHQRKSRRGLGGALRGRRIGCHRKSPSVQTFGLAKQVGRCPSLSKAVWGFLEVRWADLPPSSVCLTEGRTANGKRPVSNSSGGRAGPRYRGGRCLAAPPGEVAGRPGVRGSAAIARRPPPRLSTSGTAQAQRHHHQHGLGRARPTPDSGTAG